MNQTLNSAQIKAELFYCFSVTFLQSEVAEIGFERAAEQKLHAHIVDALGACFVDLALVFGALVAEHAFDRDGGRFVHLFFRRFFGGATEMALQDAAQKLFDLGGVEILVHWWFASQVNSEFRIKN